MQSPQPASSPAPTLLESTLSAVAAAVLLRAPLPAQVVALLRALFPSAAELLASAPAADGLGLEVCSLLPAPAAPREQLAAPLPAGGALCFGLRKGPAPGELALMEAFAAALAARLGQLDASLQVRCGVCAVLCRAVPCPRGGAIDWRGGRVRCMGTPTLDCPDRRLRGACSQACTRVLCHSSTFVSRPRPTPPPPRRRPPLRRPRRRRRRPPPLCCLPTASGSQCRLPPFCCCQGTLNALVFRFTIVPWSSRPVPRQPCRLRAWHLPQQKPLEPHPSQTACATSAATTNAIPLN